MLGQVHFVHDALLESLSLSIFALQCTWVSKYRATHRIYWQCCLCSSLLIIQKACSVFQHAVCFNGSVPDKPLLSVTAQLLQLVFFLYYSDWGCMSKITVAYFFNAAACILPNVKLLCSPLAWKSWTWCVLICLHVVCIVCSQMAVQLCSISHTYAL